MTNDKDIIKVRRIIEYEGPRNEVEYIISHSVQGEKQVLKDTVIRVIESREVEG